MYGLSVLVRGECDGLPPYFSCKSSAFPPPSVHRSPTRQFRSSLRPGVAAVGGEQVEVEDLATYHAARASIHADGQHALVLRSVSVTGVP